MMAQVNKNSSDSVVFGDTLGEIQSVVLSKGSEYPFALRAFGVEALVNAQSLDARNVIANAEKELVPMAATRVDHQEMLIKVRKVLEEGYFAAVSD
jgi:hypothetical protein